MSDIEWAAGLADGEGSWWFDNGPRFSLCSVDEDVVMRFSELFSIPVRKSGRKTIAGKTVWITDTRPRALELGKTLSPWLGTRRLDKLTQLGGDLLPRSPDTVDWLAGLLEGEGCFDLHRGKYPRIRVVMNDHDVVERAALLLQGNTVHRKDGSLEAYVRGKKAEAVGHTLFPKMSVRRQNKLAEVFA